MSTDTAEHLVKLKAALPRDSRNGLADRAAHIASNGSEPVWALVRLDLHEMRRRAKDGTETAVLTIAHIEPLQREPGAADREYDDLVGWAEEQAAERRQVSGQQVLPTERDELLAAFRELADDTPGMPLAELEVSYADRYDGLLPAGDPEAVLHLREFLAERHAELGLPDRAVEDVALPGDGDSGGEPQ